MSGLQRVIRHPDRVNDPHVRARELASTALLEPLDPADAAWFEEHLEACDPCRATADDFAGDAALLHGLRADIPLAPRDLGARVSLALDDEVRRELRRRGSRAPARSAGRPSARPRLALAGLAAAALVGLLILPLALPLGAPTASPPPGASLAPQATPITVATQPVAWVRRLPDGTYVIARADVSQVCPGADGSACGTLDAGARTLAALDGRPSSVLLPRDGSPAVVVGQGSVYAIAMIPEPDVTTPPPGSSSVPSSEPAQSPTASGEPASPPVDSPAPSRSPDAASPPPPATEPAETPAPSAEPSPPEPTPSTSGEPATPEPATPEPATPLPTMPPPTPAPTAAATLAIAEGVALVGAPPAYSPDAQWVAFSARPVDGSQGPDVYVWRVGEPQARILTTDHASVFSGWLNGSILASAARVAGSDPASDAAPAPEADPATVVARSFLVDPGTGSVAAIPLDGAWRPVIDPTERLVVYWTGTLAWSASDQAWLPAAGHLVTASWPAVRGAVPSPASSEEPGTTPSEAPGTTPGETPGEAPGETPAGTPVASPAATSAGEPGASPSPVTGAEPVALPGEVAGAECADWELRFDPAGRRLGVWVADPAQPGTGRLTLVAVADDGRLGTVVLDGTAALPGFSLDADRLAWSTPPGQNGQGSVVVVYAWSGDAAGQLQSMPEPGDEPVVVAR